MPDGYTIVQFSNHFLGFGSRDGSLDRWARRLTEDQSIQTSCFLRQPPKQASLSRKSTQPSQRHGRRSCVCILACEPLGTAKNDNRIKFLPISPSDTIIGHREIDIAHLPSEKTNRQKNYCGTTGQVPTLATRLFYAFVPQ